MNKENQQRAAVGTSSLASPTREPSGLASSYIAIHPSLVQSAKPTPLKSINKMALLELLQARPPKSV